LVVGAEKIFNFSLKSILISNKCSIFGAGSRLGFCMKKLIRDWGVARNFEGCRFSIFFCKKLSFWFKNKNLYGLLISKARVPRHLWSQFDSIQNQSKLRTRVISPMMTKIISLFNFIQYKNPK